VITHRRTTLALVTAMATLGGQPLAAQERESVAKEAAARLAWDVETRKSVDILVQTRIIPEKNDPAAPPAFDTVEDHFLISAAGQRMCESRHLLAGKLVNRYTYYDQLTKCADVSYHPDNLEKPQGVVIKRQFWMENLGDRKQLPVPLIFLYVGREPLQKALLTKARPVGEDEVIGRPCDVFLFQGVLWNVPQDHVYHLDRATAIPLRVESYVSQEARERKQPAWVWIARSLDEIDGHHVPLKSTWLTYADDGSLVMTHEEEVKSISFGKDFAESTFWPTLQPGVTVFDTIAKKRYQVPGAKAATPTAPSPSPANSSLMEARRPADWVSVLRVASLAVGSVVLVAGLGLWVRQRWIRD
jgi:hypothetical protein